MSVERQAVEVLTGGDASRVVELRAFGGSKTISGYFNDHEALAEKARSLDAAGHKVYVTLNEVNPALLSRHANRASNRGRGESNTSDNDIPRRRWLPVDFDPTRPSGVSATDGEKEAAKVRAREVYEYLKARGWSEPVVGDSGNGYHLLYGVDLSNDAASLALVRGVLESLAWSFSDERVSADTANSNAARIWKLYGTTARKGDDTPERPHRVSGLLRIPGVVQVVGRELLEVEAADKPEPPRGESRGGHRGDFDLAGWVAEHGVPVKCAGPWQGQPGGYRYILEGCPWNGHTDNAAYIVQGPGGWIAAGCQHDSCQGFGWRELREHFEPGAYERGGNEKPPGGPTNGAEGPFGVLLSEVVPERVRWLWKSRIARGKLCLVDGDPGLGKSAMTLDWAARVTAGRAWPDGAELEVGGVVILSAEDGLADTIRPRFDAAGGVPSKARAISTVPDAEGNERQIAIPDDLAVIEAAIELVGAVLVLVDPLMAFLPGDVNSHRDQDVRRALAPLARLAERTGTAIVLVRHLNKAASGNALYRGGGSIGIVGAARSGLLVAKHPEDDGRRVVASIKSNLAAPAPSLVFGLEPSENGAVRVGWKGETSLDASALLAAPTDPEERSVLQEAKDLLREVLSEGPVPASEVKQEARSADISERTLKTAKRELGILTSREGEPGKRGGGKWFWTLPTGPVSIKEAKPEGLHPKPRVGRTDADNSAYLSQKQDAGLRVQGDEDVKEANGRCPLNGALSADMVGAETRRSKSGPAKALAAYLEKPTQERLKWLTKAVLTVRGMDTGGWKRHAGAVKEAASDPGNHPLDCGCVECA